MLNNKAKIEMTKLILLILAALFLIFAVVWQIYLSDNGISGLVDKFLRAF
jgi:hypothetical protein